MMKGMKIYTHRMFIYPEAEVSLYYTNIQWYMGMMKDMKIYIPLPPQECSYNLRLP